MMAEALDRLANAVGRIEIECHAQRQMQNTRAFHRHLEDQAMKALLELGALPEPALPFQPIKTAKPREMKLIIIVFSAFFERTSPRRTGMRPS